jgi:hypothetical protein
MTSFRDILRALAEHDARVVVVGGFALQLHGSAYITADIDFAYERTRENAKRIVAALAPFNPRPRGFAADLPIVFDPQTLMSSEVLTLETTAGDVDLFAVIKGVGGFGEVDAASETISFDCFAVRVLGIDALIAAKRAAARPKDEPGILELQALKEARAIADEPPDESAGDPQRDGG